jgi:hypothetical protein
VEYVRSGRTVCHTCFTAIAEASIRVVREVASPPWADLLGAALQQAPLIRDFHHLACRVPNCEHTAVQGLPDMRPDDQERIRALMANVVRPDVPGDAAPPRKRELQPCCSEPVAAIASAPPAPSNSIDAALLADSGSSLAAVGGGTIEVPASPEHVYPSRLFAEVLQELPGIVVSMANSAAKVNQAVLDMDDAMELHGAEAESGSVHPDTAAQLHAAQDEIIRARRTQGTVRGAVELLEQCLTDAGR